MKNFRRRLTGFAAALVLVAQCAFAAGPDASQQPSTSRVISHADMRNVFAKPGAVVILHLRRNSDYDKDSVTLPGARRLDPDKIADWASSLPKDKEILLFCAHGRSISNASIDFLTKQGYQARLVAGGFDAWKDAGGATVAKTK